MISVIVRTLGSAWLADALESLAAQTRRDFETVVVDMSEGCAGVLLAQFASRLPSMRVVEQRPVSRPIALNVGIAAATTPAIAILDEDNLYDAEQIAMFLDGLESTHAGWVYCGVRHTTWTTDGKPIASRETGRPFDFDALLHENFIYATGSAVRKSLWEQLGGYDERFEVLEDWEFLIRVAQAAPIAYLNRVAGESRKFTGVAGASSFERDLVRARRCHAAIRWKHRRVYFARYRAAGMSMPRILARGVRVAGRVLPWFVHNGGNAPRHD